MVRPCPQGETAVRVGFQAAIAKRTAAIIAELCGRTIWMLKTPLAEDFPV